MIDQPKFYGSKLCAGQNSDNVTHVVIIGIKGIHCIRSVLGLEYDTGFFCFKLI